MPEVTAIIASHNGRDFIAAAIESVLNQTRPPTQVLVVDDSTDDSPALIESYATRARGHVQLLRVPPCNISKARNLALDAALSGGGGGDFIAFLDGDDVWLPDRLAQQLDLLEADPQAAGAWCRCFDFTHNLDDLARRSSQRTADNPSLTDVILASNIPASTQLVRRTALGATRFDERSGHAEDVLFAAELRLKGAWRLVDTPLVGKRLHGAQVTRNPWHTLWSAQARIRWCREHSAVIGTALAEQLEETIARDLATHLESLYWQRQVRGLPALRRAAAELCPRQMQASFLARTRIYPRWVYRLRDLFSTSHITKSNLAN
jgi:glycosyltransferase involved in cell wall biosynthesis